MGFLRKATFVATGGMSGLVIKANSKKERIANASEKQAKILERAARRVELEDHQNEAIEVSASDGAVQLGAVQLSVSEELRNLAELRDEGILSEEEFATQKAKLLG